MRRAISYADLVYGQPKLLLVACGQQYKFWWLGNAYAMSNKFRLPHAYATSNKFCWPPRRYGWVGFDNCIVVASPTINTIRCQISVTCTKHINA